MFPRDRATASFDHKRGQAAESYAAKEQHLGSRNRHEDDGSDAAAESQLGAGSPVLSGVDGDIRENKKRLKQEQLPHGEREEKKRKTQQRQRAVCHRQNCILPKIETTHCCQAIKREQ